MDSHNLDELWRRRRAQTVRLMEVADLTRQILQAAERRDEVSVNVLLSMREDPLQRLQEMDNSFRAYLQSLPQKDAIRVASLLNGETSPNPEELQFCQQADQYARLLQTTMDMDRRISLRVGGNRSFYQKYRP